MFFKKFNFLNRILERRKFVFYNIFGLFKEMYLINKVIFFMHIFNRKKNIKVSKKTNDLIIGTYKNFQVKIWNKFKIYNILISFF